MDEDLKRQMAQLVEGVMKLRLWATLPDDVLAFVLNAENNPTPQSLASLEAYHAELAKHLLARAYAYRPPVPQQAQPAAPPEQFSVQSKNFLN